MKNLCKEDDKSLFSTRTNVFKQINVIEISSWHVQKNIFYTKNPRNPGKSSSRSPQSCHNRWDDRSAVMIMQHNCINLFRDSLCKKNSFSSTSSAAVDYYPIFHFSRTYLKPSLVMAFVLCNALLEFFPLHLPFDFIALI